MYKRQDIDSEYETPEPFKPSLCYKFDDSTSYTITNQDFKCLYNKDWINDTILDFFTKYFIEESIKKNIISKSEVSIMSSFFYTKLISDPENYYDNVKKWVSNSNLFEKKYVVIPINMNFHWFGCIITNLDELLKFVKENSVTLRGEKRNPIDTIKISAPIKSGKENASKILDDPKDCLLYTSRCV